MNALTSLLPGLREARAPLISGYLWLLAIWLGFGQALPNRDTNPTFARLWEMIDAVGPIGIGLAVSVVAYFLGSAIQSATQFLAVRFLGQWWHDGRYTIRFPRPRDYIDQTLRPKLVAREATAMEGDSIPLAELPARIIAELTAYYREGRDKRWADAFDDVVVREFGRAWGQLSAAVERAVDASEGRAQVDYESRPGHDTIVTFPEAGSEEVVRFTIPQAFLGGLSLIQSRLFELAKGAGLKAEKFNAEAELREAVAFALTAIVGVLCVQVGIAWIAALVLPIALLVQARSMRLHASWELIDALRARAGTAELERITPLFARCRTQTEELTRAIEETDWERVSEASADGLTLKRARQPRRESPSAA